jgi:hypothetical protein
MTGDPVDSAGAAPGAPPTVASLHVLAEHVLGAGLHAATGRIGLQAVPGGFATPASADGALGGRLAVSGGELVITRPDGSERRAPITTPAAAAAFFGVEPGMPSSVYPPTTELVLDAPLDIEPAVARQVCDWFGLGDAALARFGDLHAVQSPSGRTLWPEHFDLALAMSEVNYGVSPGDPVHAEPYLYVGPWTPRSGSFWNEPFGASVPASVIATVDDALGFFEEGRLLAAESS